jgi:glutamine synthetase
VGDENSAVELLATDAVAITDALEQSHLARQVLSDMYIDSLVASRRYEQRVFGSLSHHDLVEQLRLTWST